MKHHACSRILIQRSIPPESQLMWQQGYYAVLAIGLGIIDIHTYYTTCTLHLHRHLVPFLKPLKPSFSNVKTKFDIRPTCIGLLFHYSPVYALYILVSGNIDSGSRNSKNTP
ncbi:uncharacterized protein C8R40DRAFT_425760 [Lentinula edodes]|uniref:uncharacterized protein n=1 Tax=Lentinula edodes TaxID=5353 RepID=UPI001E8EC8B0|nr:uncharacterized protein C8R40DRAFT_425760 [Lentinula edodes]KAH7872862.1 hypothetical protein C8R40DRAFT_425760 [Lentinula edodes]